MAKRRPILRDIKYRLMSCRGRLVNRYRFLFALTFLLSVGTSAQAQLITVNSAADPGDGVCDAANCTLREAILVSNN